MYVLGLGGSEHDFACALCKDGQIVTAIEEERITRKKHGIGLLESLQIGKSVDYCLEVAGIKKNDIKLVVSNDILKAAPLFGFSDYLNINHHLAHAASAYYASGYNSSAILVIDAAGSAKDGLIETTTLAIGYGNSIQIISKIYGTEDGKYGLISNSIGQLYTLITEMIGFRILQEGKTMGLAPYGTTKYVERFRHFVHLLSEGKYEISHNALIECKEMMSTELEKCEASDVFQLKADFACAVQEVTNEILLHVARYLAQKTSQTTLCYSGGVALNSVANGMLEESGIFKDYFIQPGAGDSGTAIGAAYWGYYYLNNQDEKKYKMGNCFLGKQYSEKDVDAAINSLRTERDFDIYHAHEIPYKIIAQILNSGEAICVFIGRSEFGPRALGNRSILCAATDKSVRDKINLIKGREWFRPLAPAVLHEFKTTYFCSDFYNPFMLFVDTVQPHMKERIPAVVHIDDTARTQSVLQDSNPNLYNIIYEYYKLSGVPVLLNTSFNIGYEPIVETPYDAIKSFLRSEICYLAIENYIISKCKTEILTKYQDK